MSDEQSPSEESALPVPDREKIDRLADQFEREFKAGKEPLIEAYLEQLPELRPHLIKELLTLDVELRRDAGQHPSIDEYRQRSPEDEQIIERVFASLEKTFDNRPDPDPTETKDDPAPEQLGRYVIQRRLGKGGFGVVYLAHDPQLDRPVALKVPRQKRFKTQEQVGKFIEEARTAAQLKHPGIVTVHDVQEQDGWPYIVQEFIDGQDLAKWSNAQRPSYQKIAELLIGISDAVVCSPTGPDPLRSETGQRADGHSWSAACAIDGWADNPARVFDGCHHVDCGERRPADS